MLGVRLEDGGREQLEPIDAGGHLLPDERDQLRAVRTDLPSDPEDRQRSTDDVDVEEEQRLLVEREHLLTQELERSREGGGSALGHAEVLARRRSACE